MKVTGAYKKMCTPLYNNYDNKYFWYAIKFFHVRAVLLNIFTPSPIYYDHPPPLTTCFSMDNKCTVQVQYISGSIRFGWSTKTFVFLILKFWAYIFIQINFFYSFKRMHDFHIE